MTTWEEPPLTRREARERERMLAEQAAAAAAPEPSAPIPAAPPAGFPAAFPAPSQGPVLAAAPQPAPQPVPQAAPQPAPQYSAAPQPSAPQPAVGAVPPPPFPAPGILPAAPQAAPALPVPVSAGFGAETALGAAPALARVAPPERTLTRRELRALLAGEEDFDELDELPEIAPAAGESRSEAPVAAAPVAPARTDSRAAATGAGHWADGLAAADRDEPQPFDQLLARGGLSHGVPTTTSALILPVLPDGVPLTTPHPMTGEIIVTGSIDLPRSFGATGAHPDQVDSSDLDRLFEQVEDAPATGVAPVAATRAISTQGPPRDYLAAPAKESASMPLILAITAGVLALGVVATFVVGVVFRLF